MKKLISMALMLCAVFISGGTAIAADYSVPSGGLKAAVESSYGSLPLCFGENPGQAGEGIKYLSYNLNFNLLLTSTEAIIVFNNSKKEKVSLKLAGANTNPQVSGQGLLPGKCNYLIGSDPANWKKNIRQYSGVRYKGVYNGIDMVYHGSQKKLEYDFILSPGADPGLIRISFEGAKGLELDKAGNLVINLGDGHIIFNSPEIYQAEGKEKKYIPGSYVICGGMAGFKTGAYDKSKELVIDPVLVYSTYLGGPNSDGAYGLALDRNGNAYITGSTSATFFPTTPGVYQPAEGSKAFVTKFNVSGNSLVYSTLIGGLSGTDTGRGIAVNGAGNAFITGSTNSPDFPLHNPLQASKGAGTDCFAAEFTPDGSGVVFSTFLGGNGEDSGNALDIDAAGNAYITGITGSTDLTATASCYQPANAGGEDAFIAKINAGGAGFAYLTYLGGNSDDGAFSIRVDPAGFAFITGFTSDSTFPSTAGSFMEAGAGNRDVFITKINQTGTALVYSTYAGGSADDVGACVALDGSGNAYVTGYTDSSDFSGIGAGSIQAVNEGNTDVFVLKLNASGNAFYYATYLGGGGTDRGCGIAVDGDGNAYVTGLTQSPYFPLVNPVQSVFGSATGKAFVSMINPDGNTLVFSTYLGGSGFQAAQGMALDSQFNMFITGWTDSTDYPVTSGVYQPACAGSFDAFISKIITQNPPTPTATPTYTATKAPTATVTPTRTASDTPTASPTPATNTCTPVCSPANTLYVTATNTATALSAADIAATETAIALYGTPTMTETVDVAATETAIALYGTPTMTETVDVAATETAIALYGTPTMTETVDVAATETALALIGTATGTATIDIAATETAIALYGTPTMTETVDVAATETAIALYGTATKTATVDIAATETALALIGTATRTATIDVAATETALALIGTATSTATMDIAATETALALIGTPTSTATMDIAATETALALIGTPTRTATIDVAATETALALIGTATRTATVDIAATETALALIGTATRTATMDIAATETALALNATPTRTVTPISLIATAITTPTPVNTIIFSPNELVIYPVPMKDSGYVQYYMAQAGTVKIRIYNETGTLAYFMTQRTTEGKQMAVLDTRQLAFGVYFCVIYREFDNGTKIGTGMKKFLVIK